MPTLTVTVYLNDAARNILGFNRVSPARLRPAGVFELTLAEHLRGQHLADAALEVIFEQLNIDVPEHDWAIAYRLIGHRSFSVGDVAVVGETAFACAPSGWTVISADDLNTALTH
jgi:hypothetical protein